MSVAIMEKILKHQIKEQSDSVYEVAYAVVGIYYAEKRRYHKEFSGTNSYRTSHHGCRARRNKGPGTSIEWYRNEYDGATGSKKTRSIYQKLPKSGVYSANRVFDWRKLPWEVNAFHAIEPRLAELRKQSLALGKLSKAVHTFFNTAEIYDENEYFEMVNEYYYASRSIQVGEKL